MPDEHASGYNDELIQWAKDQGHPVPPKQGKYDDLIRKAKAMGDPVPQSSDYNKDLAWAREYGLFGNTPTPHDADVPHLENFPNTDLGNAERLKALYGADILYVAARGWFTWAGTHWEWDEGDRGVHLKAHGTIRAMYSRAQSLIEEIKDGMGSGEIDALGRFIGESSPEAEERKQKTAFAQALLTWARKSEGSARIEAMIGQCQYMCQVPSDSLDSHGWLFNVQNGTLDLRTGKRQDHNREDRLTIVSPVTWDPNAGYAPWDAFIERILPDPERRRFVQRASGYSLTGDISEEKLFFLHGTTSTGKSTFLRAVHAVLGPYGCTVDFKVFLDDKYDRAETDSTARMASKRMVSSIEVQDGKKMAEGLLTKLTGGDPVTGKFLYKGSFEYIPKYKLWLAANNKPRIRHDDDAIWRRVVQIPFDQHIPPEERDPSLKVILIDSDIAGPAVLRWMVEGCLEWQNSGLDIPDDVQAATDQYRKDMDPLKGFLEECCFFSKEYEVTNKALYQAFTAWAKDAGVAHPMSQKSFTALLEKRDDVIHETDHARRWFGIGLPAYEN